MSMNEAQGSKSAGAQALASAATDSTPDEPADSESEQSAAENTPSPEEEVEAEDPEPSETPPDQQSQESVSVGRPEQTLTQFHGTIPAEPLQTALENAASLIEEGTAYVDEAGFEFVAVDPGNVGLVETTIPAECFEAFDVESGRMGLPVTRFVDLISMADADQDISLSLNGKTQKLTVEFGEIEYTMALLDPETIRSVQDPDAEGTIEFESEFVISGSAVKRGVKGADLISEYITFETAGDDREVGMVAEGSAGTSEEVIADGDPEFIEGTKMGDVCAKFSLELLRGITKRMPSQEAVELCIGDSVPLRVVFTSESGVRTRFLIAPRISES